MSRQFPGLQLALMEFDADGVEPEPVQSDYGAC
ncbi:MAG: hypothetical protein PWR07_188 [Bacillota bacterium]|nr:hypothetical protein [Bacillota bacterium]